MNRKTELAIIYIALTMIAIIVVMPLLTLYFVAFAGTAYAGSTSGFTALAFIGTGLHFGNFQEVFTVHEWSVSVRNTVITAFAVAGLALAVSIPAAYSIVRMRPKGGRSFALWLLSLRLAPPIAFVVPVYFLILRLGLLDTTLGLILAQASFEVPFGIWLLAGFFRDVPADYEEAALVDGCTRRQAFTKVYLHLVVPGLMATFVFMVMFSWTDLLFPLVLTRREATTIPYAITLTRTQIGVKWGIASTLAIMDALPLIIMVLLVQKYFVRGLTFGGVKG